MLLLLLLLEEEDSGVDDAADDVANGPWCDVMDALPCVVICDETVAFCRAPLVTLDRPS